jgi:ArsR family transcriptional regulator
MDTENFERLADSFKALSDPRRLKLLHLLSQKKYVKKLSVSELAEQLGISQPNVSHHIKILKAVGLVRCVKKDGCSYYATDTSRLKDLTSSLDPHLE